MHRAHLALALAGAAVLSAGSAFAAGTIVDPLVIPGVGPHEAYARGGAQPAPVPMYYRPQPARAAVVNAPSGGGLGGGLIEMLVTGGNPAPRRNVLYNAPPRAMTAPMQAAPMRAPQVQTATYAPAPLETQRSVPQQYMRAEVDYPTSHAPGTLVVDTPSKHLYLVLGGGRALRYGIGVGRPGFTWSGVKTITRKAEWPGWTPPPEMRLRRPDLPAHMEGGPANPLGARAMYLGSSLYRIHGTNEPYTIGQNVSSGCIRMMNEDVTDLYERVRVGTRVIVM